MTTTGRDPLPPAPQPPEDEYPSNAVAPRFDEHGRRFMPEVPWPGIVNLALGPVDVMILHVFWKDTARKAAAAGNGEAWSFAEMRAAHFLRIAREIQPECQAAFVSLTREQLEAMAEKHARGIA
jgi:hypothetical protein